MTDPDIYYGSKYKDKTYHYKGIVIECTADHTFRVPLLEGDKPYWYGSLSLALESIDLFIDKLGDI